MSLDEPDDVLTVPEAARVLRLGKNAVYAGCAAGVIPHRRIGKAIRFSRRALMGWLASCGPQGSPKET